MSAVQSHRAHVINLCYGVVEACSLTDLQSLKQQAELILNEMGNETKTTPAGDFGDLL